jgi:hypothetical protein
VKAFKDLHDIDNVDRPEEVTQISGKDLLLRFSAWLAKMLPGVFYRAAVIAKRSDVLTLCVRYRTEPQRDLTLQAANWVTDAPNDPWLRARASPRNYERIAVAPLPKDRLIEFARRALKRRAKNIDATK